ncbi:MAG: [protein-PII] uridylyltransferase, partial [Bdellovibrionales bacterium]
DSGIKVGHAVRGIDETITVTNEDTKTRSALLDARLITGDAEHFDTLQTALKKQRTGHRKKAYVKAKLAERDTRHTRLGDTRYVLEPNIKDGKGGLRDYQTLFWIAAMLYDAPDPKRLQDLKILTKKERQRFEKAYDFLLTVRCHLHDIAGRGEERLHFDIQPALAERLGYTHRNNARAVERFMKHYFLVTRDIGDLTRILIAAIEDEEDRRAKIIPPRAKNFLGFEITNGRLNFTQSQNLNEHPVDILRFFRVAQSADLDLHPAALKTISRTIKLIDAKLCANPLANQIFIEILTDKGAAMTLRRMNESGVLGRFIPEFGRIIALMQFDRYHVFTVDEHILHAIQTLHDIENDTLKAAAPLACTLIKNIKHRRALFVAMLLHDICKGRENKKADHSQLGAELALKLCPRFGLNDEETRLVSWLVYDHLFMSETAFKRDLEDPKTLEDFLFRIHDTERLQLLTILTTADIMAVGPDCWSDWKAALLKDLYTMAEARLGGKQPQKTKTKRIEFKNEGDKNTHIEITQDAPRNATRIDIFTTDKSGLFAILCGALAACETSVIEARIETLPHGRIADSFLIQSLNGKPILKPHRLDQIRKSIEDALDGTHQPKPPAQSKTTKPKDRVFDSPPQILVNTAASNNFTLFEIYANDRPALLFTIANAFKRHNITIHSAKISTRGATAIDVFYVTDANGQKLTDESRITALKNEILKTLHND